MTERQLNTHIEDYIRNYEMEGCLKLCLNKSTLLEAIETAVSSEENHNKNKLNDHQRRIGRDKLKLYTDKLIGEKYSEIEQCRSFDGLYNTVRSCSMDRIGKLTTYDIALRIAHYLSCNTDYANIMPDKVYIHAGAWTGAKRLFGQSKRLKTIMSRDLFPPPLKNSKLKCCEIENFLCIKKDVLEPYAGRW